MSLLEGVPIYFDLMKNLEVGDECVAFTAAVASNNGPKDIQDFIIPRGAMANMCEQLAMALGKKLAS